MAFSRSLRESLGDQPEVLRDLSVSLHRIAGIEGALGHLDQAREACAEGLAISRSLRVALGDQPTVLRDLTVGLNRLGEIEGGLGHLDQARDAFAESLLLDRALRTLLGDQPTVLRDLARALGHLATVSEDEESTRLAAEVHPLPAPSPHDYRQLSFSSTRK